MLFRTHHTCVLGGMQDYRLSLLRRQDGVNRQLQEAERSRVWPFVQISEEDTMQYTKVYQKILDIYKVKTEPTVTRFPEK